MSNSIYASLTRQSGLMKEMQTIAHNMANSATTGFRSEGMVFSEHVKATGDGQKSISFATADGHSTRFAHHPVGRVLPLP